MPPFVAKLCAILPRCDLDAAQATGVSVHRTPTSVGHGVYHPDTPQQAPGTSRPERQRPCSLNPSVRCDSGGNTVRWDDVAELEGAKEVVFFHIKFPLSRNRHHVGPDSGDPLAIEKSWSEVEATELLEPAFTLPDLHRAVRNTTPPVTQEDIKTHLEFTNGFGADGAHDHVFLSHSLVSFVLVFCPVSLSLQTRHFPCLP
ncbi:hypothetical protein PtA15_5A190 [Puccinia triticina]|uniref:Spastin/Vps4 C-terminal domain-containing protein n=1 Tax=Puccinia triticina TaxID=208348 RepID=A0ABY7CKV5_9BASI|nr:uncharacterized protein PtA15_5A190 [Puccinia triticina]WAQ84617.1 hypothetical protein PtA15_5A190 [Puccinia triticina]